MVASTSQENNTVTDGDLVGRDKYQITNYASKTKLSTLFKKLQDEFELKKECEEISDDLKRYYATRDTVGLEKKLTDGGRSHMLEDAAWLKQEYYKKLTKFQFFEPAQEIHAFLLSIVLEKFRNIIYPKIRQGESETEISRTISTEIITPIVRIIQEEGCHDIMGLSSTDVDGMIYFLTGQCHIKWTKNDSVSPSI